MNPLLSSSARLDHPEIAFWVIVAVAAFALFGQTSFSLGANTIGGSRIIQANANAPAGAVHAGCNMNGGGCGCGGGKR